MSSAVLASTYSRAPSEGKAIVTVIAAYFMTMDGFISDPDGSYGTPGGGWAFRHGPESFSGDKFQYGPLLEHGTLLLGRRTWQLFAQRWPGRDTPFAARMNAARKVVASRTLTDVSAWHNSRLLAGDLVEAVRHADGDIFVAGSVAVAHALISAGLIDEYRFLTDATVLGAGQRLFPGDLPAAQFKLLQAERSGPFAFTRYGR